MLSCQVRAAPHLCIVKTIQTSIFNLLLIFATSQGLRAQPQPNMEPAHITNTEGKVIKHGKLVYSEITIRASAEKAWKIFSQFEAYPEWNPFIRSLTGTPRPGKRIEARLQLPGKDAMTFKPVVLTHEPFNELRWIGKLFIPRLFDGEHTFKLRDNKDGTVTLIQYERFRGIIVPFLKKMLDKDTRSGFEVMNQAFKQRCEIP